MANENVTALHGGPIYQPDPNPHCIEMLEDMLERARSGEVIGMVACSLNSQGSATWERAGKTGGFAIIGALSSATAWYTANANIGAE